MELDTSYASFRGHRKCTHGTHKVSITLEQMITYNSQLQGQSFVRPRNCITSLQTPCRKSEGQHGIPEIYVQKHVQFIRKLKTGGTKLEPHGLNELARPKQLLQMVTVLTNSRHVASFSRLHQKEHCVLMRAAAIFMNF